MNYDELAFLNQQLASMLKSGIPLEGALKQLADSLPRSEVRTELKALEADLAKGIPWAEAVHKRRLPELYQRILALGGQSGQLPVVLTLLADYYQRTALLWTRLKALLIYPAIVLVVSLAISIGLIFNFRSIQAAVEGLVVGPGGFAGRAWFMTYLATLVPFSVVALTSLVLLLVLVIPPLRRWASWHLPAFKEASLYKLAAAGQVLFSAGKDADAALALMQQLEKGSPAEEDLIVWRDQLAKGEKSFVEVSPEDSVFPPLFRWILVQSGEDLSQGFQQAAELYYNRANYRSEVVLQSLLPLVILIFGCLILIQFLPLVHYTTLLFQGLGGM